MRRNLASWFKFVALAALTVLLTTLVFRAVRTPGEHRRASSPSQQPPQEPDGPDGQADWHDYARMEAEGRRRGLGEHGAPAELPAWLEARKDQLYKANGFNAALSDAISVNRSLPDIRHPECRRKRYPRRLEPVSVIISFHNEHLSTLLRTCWSVVNRSPRSLLREIVLVDDASTRPELGAGLDAYAARHLPQARVVRLPRRAGLIRGRLAGARRAAAAVLVFLDSHTEANVNWLPPLLEPIARDHRTCVCPLIDVVAHDSFEYRAQDEGARGAFDWELYYKRLPLLPADLARPVEPFPSPVMAGGLFAISARFFWELGGYDPGLDIWGGEQYELSFKIWQCGGRLLDAPCSRVGHVYRKFPPFPNPGRGDFLGRNYKRVAQVWMDEYAEFVYRRKPHLRTLDPGDLSEQKALRRRLRCRPFKWFIEEVAFDLVEAYPPVEPEDLAFGEVRSLGAGGLCLDVARRAGRDVVAADVCRADRPGAASGEQDFSLTWRKDIRPGGRPDCLDVSEAGRRAPVALYPCHGKQGNQLWRYDVAEQRLLHGYGARCLDVDPASRAVFVADCEPDSPTQKWRVEHANGRDGAVSAGRRRLEA
ncbi:N-acetylgalactosaminyltransferase 6 [Phymastichus coffea]|uniref:N-acetylgalactosaminyltransferase 6 n=1 Tax=Phymastichus coffea TaxID=108790 RepID=UPI00273BD5C7|nr:N-acetylgalactosaminyltransferase 6 [Phymastichus coffea]